jgi:cephalosporin hydroxylase
MATNIDTPIFLEQYHTWFYRRELWKRTFLGVPCLKSPLDLWNYQEIISELKPCLVVEFGTYKGGSALFFAEVLTRISPEGFVLTVDNKDHVIDTRVTNHPRIERLICESTSPIVHQRVTSLRGSSDRPIFVVLDDDHSEQHVLAELLFLRSLLKTADYLVVEDGNINGHPVRSDFGPGPLEALRHYMLRFPEDYRRDVTREWLFGFTFAVEGYLVRC